MKIPIVCRTHGRAGNVTTFRVFPNMILCVSKSQEPLYRKFYPDAEYLVHPDDVVGLPAKINWQFQNLGSFFSVDDDVKKMVRLDVTSETPAEVLPGDAEQVIFATADIAKQMDVYYFGFAQFDAPMMMRPQTPFRLTGYIGGHAFGVIEGHGLSVHPDAKTVDDYWLSALNAYKHRICFRDDRFRLTQSNTFGGVGGLADQRTMEVEREGTELLRRHFGHAIRMKMGTQAAKLKHQAQRSLYIPWKGV